MSGCTAAWAELIVAAVHSNVERTDNPMCESSHAPATTILLSFVRPARREYKQFVPVNAAGRLRADGRESGTPHRSPRHLNQDGVSLDPHSNPPEPVHGGPTRPAGRRAGGRSGG